MPIMSLEQVVALDKTTPKRKLLRPTIQFMQEMREEVNEGHKRRGTPEQPWTDADEERY